MTILDYKICPLSNEECSDCTQITQTWDTERLFNDLAKAKTSYLQLSKKKSNTHNSQCGDIEILKKDEICYLCLLLNGLSHENISKKLYTTVGSIKPRISDTIYKYINEMTKTRVTNHYQVSHILEQYRRPRISFIRVTNANPNAPNSDVVEDKEMIALIDQDMYISFPEGGLPKVIRKIQH